MRTSSRVQAIFKTAVPAGSLADPEWAGDIAGLQNLAEAFAESLKNVSVFDRLMSDAAFLPVPLRQRVGIVLSGASAGVVGDGSAKPLGRLQLAAPLLELRKAAGIIVVSDELAKAGSKTANALIARELRSAVASATNAFFLTTLIEGTSVASFNSSGSDPDAIAADIRTLLGALEYGAGARLYFISSPGVAKTLATLTNAQGFVFPTMTPLGGTLCGVTVLVSDDVGDKLILLDASQIAADQLTMTLKTSEQAAIRMSDDPDAEGNPVSLWQTNSVALLCERWFGFELVRDSAVAVLENITWAVGETA